jgi:hypothetical protein
MNPVAPKIPDLLEEMWHDVCCHCSPFIGIPVHPMSYIVGVNRAVQMVTQVEVGKSEGRGHTTGPLCPIH